MIDENELPEGETVELPPDDVEVEDTEDGGAILRLKNEAQNQAATDHYANIVEEVDVSALAHVVTNLLEDVESDKRSREQRDKLYEEGLRRTGLANDAPGGANFNGATKVVHPMLIEACVDFSARVMKEMFPPGGPVKSKVYGVQDADKTAKAQRKAEFMNWQLTENIQEFRGELEQLSTQLPLGGVQYLKWRWDARRRRALPEFVPVDYMILPFAATNFYSAERRTQMVFITKAGYRDAVKEGRYLDVDLPTPENPEFTKAATANQKIEGKKEDQYNRDGLRLMYEVTTSLDIEKDGEYRPYIITIDDSTNKAVALVRNWDPDDENHEELDHVVEFPFVPWRGSAPIGLTHMIGSLAGASTGALRALLDSAHINNVPTGLRLKGGPNGQTITVQPCQLSEIQGSGAVDDIRKLVMPLPFNPPSPTLFQLLGFLVDAGKGVIQTSFEKLADGNPNAPVGTTLALIEQGMVVFSSIHSRLHEAMARCFKILHRLNSNYLTVEDIARYDNGIEVTPEDFDGPSDVVPVSDPAIFSETQRFAQVSAVQQRSMVVPGMYDMRKVEEMFLRALKIKPEDVLVEKPGQDDRDPISENVAASIGAPIYVLPQQEHLEHIQLHLAFLQSPLLGMNPANVQTFLWPMANHLREHVLNYYMAESHAAIAKAKAAGVPVDTSDAEVGIVMAVQKAVETKMKGFDQMLAQIWQQAEQFKPQPPMGDGSMQVAQLGAQVEREKLQAKQQTDALKAQTDQAKLQQQGQIAQGKLSLDAQVAQQRTEIDQMREDMRAASEQFRQAQENRRQAAELAVKERMNLQDNDTAMKIAAAEIVSGENTAFSTGGGINP